MTAYGKDSPHNRGCARLRWTGTPSMRASAVRWTDPTGSSARGPVGVHPPAHGAVGGRSHHRLTLATIPCKLKIPEQPPHREARVMRTIVLEYTYTVLARRTVTVPDDFDVEAHRDSLVFDGGEDEFGYEANPGYFDDNQFNRDIPHGVQSITWTEVTS